MNEKTREFNVYLLPKALFEMNVQGYKDDGLDIDPILKEFKDC